MKHKARKAKLNGDTSQVVVPLLAEFKENCSNDEILKILNEFESANTVEAQVAPVHSLSSYLNITTDEYKQFIITVLSSIFVRANPKSPVKKSILRIFANLTNLDTQIATILSTQLLNLLKSVELRKENYERLNDCVNAINDCFNNCPPGVTAISLILSEVFQFLVAYLKLTVDEISVTTSPIGLQVLYLYVHNSTRGLVAICQQCEIKSLVSDFSTDIIKYCVIIFNNPEIPFDTKNNCGILFVVAAQQQDITGHSILLQISSDKNVSKWGIASNDIKDDIAIACIYSGILNVVKPDQLCAYDGNFENSLLFEMCTKLIDISNGCSGNPLVVLGVCRALQLVSRSLEPLNEQDLIALLKKLLSDIWMLLDYEIDNVRRVAKIIAINIIKTSLVHRDNGHLQPLDFILTSVLDTSIHNISRYVALSLVASEVGCAVLLSKEPQLVSNLFGNFNDKSISSYIISCYETLMRHHLSEVTEDVWLHTWVYPLYTKANDQKKVAFTQDVMTCAIKLRPSILDSLINIWSTDIDAEFIIILKCALTARKIGAAIEETPEKWRGVLKFQILNTAKCHQNDEIRVTSLALIAESHKSTEIFSEWELKFVVSFLFYNINAQLPSTRQQILFLIKKILTRFSESYYAIVRNLDRLNTSLKLKNNSEEPPNCLLLKQQKSFYENFIFQFRDCIFDSLFPGANFSRRIICLEVLIMMEPILKEVLKTTKSSLEQIWKKSEVESILLCLHDTYESNKRSAMVLLGQCPVTLLKLHNIEKTKLFLNNALKLANSVKPADSATAAYILETSMYSPVLKDVLLELLSLDPVQETNSSKEYLMVKLLLKSLISQVEIGKKSLLKAAACAPMHGTLFCLRHIMQKYSFNFDLSDARWKILVDEVIETCFEVSGIVSPVVNNSSPEGHLPMDHETVDEDEDDDDTITSQMLLVCSWRSVKEISLLLGEITLNATIVTENQNGLITEQQILKIGEHFTVLLTETKHRGAFEQAYVGFSKLCTRLWRCTSQVLHQLPVTWLNDIISAVSGESSVLNSKLCATRRSAGVPFMIQAIVTSELQSGGSSNFNRCMTTLLQLANYPGDNIETRTHAMNILRAMYRHTQLGEVVIPYVAEGMTAAIRGFSKNTWAERNSATLLFSSLMTRVFGVQRTRDSDVLNNRNRMTSRVFFLRHPSLHPFLLEQIQQLTDSKCERYRTVALYPVLLLLARLYPAGSSLDDPDTKVEDFIPYVRACAENKTLKTRELAARALVSIVPFKDRFNLIKELFMVLENRPSKKNYIHGVLLQLLHLLRTSVEFEKCIDIMSVLNATRWILSCDNEDSCIISATVYMQIVHLMADRRRNIDTNSDVWHELISTINQQNNFLINGCFVGKTMYHRTAIHLQFHLTLNIIEHSINDKCLKVSNAIVNSLKSGSTDVKEFILNFLISLLSKSAKNYVLNNLDMPDEEKSLALTTSDDFKRMLSSSLEENADFIPLLKSILDIEERLKSKVLFLVSFFPNITFKLAMDYNEHNLIMFYKNYLNLTDVDDLTSAALLCIKTILNGVTTMKYTNSDNILEQIILILFEFSSSTKSLNNRYCTALILADNAKLLISNPKNNIDLHIIVWRTIMQLLDDSESIVRNTICRLSSQCCRSNNTQIAEKCREELLLEFITTLQTNSKDACISALLSWSLDDNESSDELCDNDDENFDTQVFERGEVSTYVEDMCLSKLTARMLGNIISCKNVSDIPEVFTQIIDILESNSNAWLTSKDKNIFVSTLKEIQNEIARLEDDPASMLRNYFICEKENVWNCLSTSMQYKILNVVQSLVPSVVLK